MADNNLNNAVAFLGTTLNSLLDASRAPIDSTTILNNIPKRSLSGDHISGGKIVNFASAGIKDEATSEQLVVKDSAVSIKTLVTENATISNRILAKIIVADVLEVKELKTSTPLAGGSAAEFVASANESLYGKGIMWKGQGHTKQLVFASGPDKFYSTENLELAKEREFRIDGASVLTSTALGASVTKSNIRELGRLKGLIVDGNVIIDQYIVYNSTTNRLGLGTENPNAGLSVVEDGVEVILGTKDARGAVGTYASSGFDLITDSTSRVAIGSNGNILLGNYTQAPINVSVHGKVAVGVKTIDPRVDLHVAGSIKFNERIHQYGNAAPTDGSFERGSIMWNDSPEVNRNVGWVCVRAGSPGTWLPFGTISSNG